MTKQEKEDFELVVYSALTAIEEAEKVGQKYENQAQKLQEKAVLTFENLADATQKAHRAIIKKSFYSGLFFFFGVVLVLAVGVSCVTWYTKELRAEVAQLKEQAEYFKIHAGKAKLSTCEGRLCVKIDDTFNSTNGLFGIIEGY